MPSPTVHHNEIASVINLDEELDHPQDPLPIFDDATGDLRTNDTPTDTFPFVSHALILHPSTTKEGGQCDPGANICATPH